MAWQGTSYTILLIVAATISATSALYVWLRQPVPGSRTMVLIALAGAVWLVGYALELGSADVLSKDFWNKMQYPGVVVAPTAWLVFALQYTRRQKWLTRRNLILLSVMPGLTLLAVFTNESHGLFWERGVLNVDGPFSILSRPHNVGFWIHVAYNYALVLVVTLLLIQILLHSRHLYRRQAILLLLAAPLPLMGNVLMLLGLNPLPYLDLTPLSFTVASLILTWSFFRLRVGDIVPVARGMVIESMSDGVIVLDEQNRIVDLNPVAQHVVGHTAAGAIGQPVGRVWPACLRLIERSGDRAEIGAVMLSKKDVQRTYDMRLSPILDWRDHLTGRVIVLRDATERQRAEEELGRYRDLLEKMVDERTQKLKEAQAELVRQERLSVLGRLTATVAHEIRNPLGTVRTSIFAIGDAIERNEMGRVGRALQRAERNIVRCNNIISELLDYTHDRAPQPALTLLDTWLEAVLDEQTIPKDIVCTRGLTSGVETPIDREHLRRAVINVVDNSIDALLDEGAAGNQLTVTTRVVRDRLEIRVSDTGSGIPPDVLDRIFEPLFSTKSFGVGLGLSIVKNIMQQHGGGIEIQSAVGRGTTVILWLPME